MVNNPYTRRVKLDVFTNERTPFADETRADWADTQGQIYMFNNVNYFIGHVTCS